MKQFVLEGVAVWDAVHKLSEVDVICFAQPEGFPIVPLVHFLADGDLQQDVCVGGGRGRCREGIFRLIVPQAGDDGVAVEGGDVGRLRVVGGVSQPKFFQSSPSSR